MAAACRICGKRAARGQHIARRGLAKKQGGVGRKITGRTLRTFRPNLQRVRARIDGRVMKVHVCTGCLKLGKIERVTR